MTLSVESARGLRDHNLRQIKNENHATMDVLKSMPESQLDYTPHPKCMPFAEHAVHIYQTGPVYMSILRPGAQIEKLPTPGTSALLLSTCQAMHDQFVVDYQSLADEELVNEYSFFGMSMVPGIILMGYYLPHLIHHRGQLQLYLRLAGAPCPAVYGPTADVTYEDMMKDKKG